MEQPSVFRLYLMRALYLIVFLGLGSSVWPGIVRHQDMADPLHGVAMTFWAALSLLAGLGVRYPLKMLPLLLLQMLYKAIWLAAVALPLRSASIPLTKVMLIGVIVDLIAIPWRYVFETFVRERGDMWRRAVVVNRS
jgi:hypothetical protein